MTQQTVEDILNDIDSLDQAKYYIRYNIYPSIRNSTSIPHNYLVAIQAIITKYSPTLYEKYTQHKSKVSLKKNVIYAFLNDVEDLLITTYYDIDEFLIRRTAKDNIITFFRECYASKASSYVAGNRYWKIIYKYGFDEKFPKLLSWTPDKLRSVAQRIVTPAVKCKCCSKMFRKYTVNNRRHKHVVCSQQCQNALISIRMKYENPTGKMTDEQKTIKNIKMSEKMKEKIKNGEFTPCVTNSWANSKVYIKIFDMNFRSSWEAYFYIFMKYNDNNLEYEKIRIPYICSKTNKTRNYITDFVDEENKIIYEIKPKCNIDDENTKDKELSASVWCAENGYKYEYVSNDWFEKNYDKELLKRIEDERIRTKLEKCLREFDKRLQK